MGFNYSIVYLSIILILLWILYMYFIKKHLTQWEEENQEGTKEGNWIKIITFTDKACKSEIELK